MDIYCLTYFVSSDGSQTSECYIYFTYLTKETSVLARKWIVDFDSPPQFMLHLLEKYLQQSLLEKYLQKSLLEK